jgi:hypothetical protein
VWTAIANRTFSGNSRRINGAQGGARLPPPAVSAGSEAGGEPAAAFYSLIGSANSMAWTQKRIYATCSRALQSIRLIASKSYCHGTCSTKSPQSAPSQPEAPDEDVQI